MLKKFASTMNNIAGPSNANSAVFSTQITSNASSHDSSYYSNIEPDFKWMKSSVKHLIYLVSIHFDEFYDKTLKKKVLWKKIAEEMRSAGHYCTSDDCDKKWRNIKKSYISVLQKQVQGDFSSKFPFFNDMHGFLGKEIDPLGMREQGMNKAIQENKIPAGMEFPRISYFEVSEDNNFIWQDPVVHLLLDSILEHEKMFRINSDANSVWESIRNRITSEGYDVVHEQCQRKWMNLLDGFRHYQAEGELTGIHPKWKYYSHVKRVINTMNVPVTVSRDTNLTITNMKGSVTTPIMMREHPPVILREPLHKKRKRRRVTSEKSFSEDDFDDDDEEEEEDAPQQFRAALRDLQKSLKVTERLSHLEARIDVAHKARAESKQSVVMLENILAKLREVNRNVKMHKEQEEEAAEEAERMKHERLLLNHVGENVGETTYKSTFLNLQDMANFQFMKAPKVELVDGGNETDNIILVERL